jgi:RIO kinase 1
MTDYEFRETTLFLKDKDNNLRMHSHNQFDLVDQLEDFDSLPTIRNVPKDQYTRRYQQKRKKKTQTDDQMEKLAEQENELGFNYNASKHEKAWLIDSLADFYRQQWFDDILTLVKGGGKEASVYQCLGNQTTGEKYIAAKVYRPRRFRQLRNDSLYREGRINLDSDGHELHDERAWRAIQHRTNLGMQLMHTSWIEHEFQTLTLLHKAGADVPTPYVSGNNAILMAYIGWDDLPAPTLNKVNLQPREIHTIFDRIVHNVELMLANRRVHGDLSAYNILYHEGGISLIDFPQTIDPDENRNAYAIFRRDILRLCNYFQGQGLRCNPGKLADDLWLKHGYSIHQAADPRLFALEDLDK